MLFGPLLAAYLLAASAFPFTPNAIVPAERTPVVLAELPSLLAAGHVQALGRRPSRARLAMAVALVRLENGNGREVFGFNLGNLGPARGAPRSLMRDGGYYQAFASPIEGAAALWSRLAAWCPGALRYFDAGMAREAGDGLRRCGYHRMDQRYGEALRQLYGPG